MLMAAQMMPDKVIDLSGNYIAADKAQELEANQIFKAAQE